MFVLSSFFAVQSKLDRPYTPKLVSTIFDSANLSISISRWSFDLSIPQNRSHDVAKMQTSRHAQWPWLDWCLLSYRIGYRCTVHFG